MTNKYVLLDICKRIFAMIVTNSGENVGELPELVRIKRIKRSPYLVTIFVTIMSLFVLAKTVIFLGTTRISEN